ncbi:MAG: glycosyltransferase family 9 protein [Bdellovibrionales bacterium]|nr:glycosyltransferase family 9 protein [Bdellovibrionales bacterium]
MTNSIDHPRILIFRLSSLGDLILCSSAISALARLRPGAKVDWVVGSGFFDLLKSDSRLHRVIPFDRSLGFSEWHSLCRSLFESNYDEVIDLHGSLRTRYAMLYFQARRLLSGRGMMPWRRLGKMRIRRVGFFIFKSLWPEKFRPSARGGIGMRASALADGDTRDHPNLSHFIDAQPSGRIDELLRPLREGPRGFIAVMPSSAWPGKRWPVSHWSKALEMVGVPVAILGAPQDSECFELEKALSGSSVSFVSFFRDSSLQDSARVISLAKLIVANDTGLVHLAEAIGKSAVVIFGPTHPDLGFGPWRASSQSLGSNLWCRPCSKDGTACFRGGARRFLCMGLLKPETVAESVKRSLAFLDEPGVARPSQ